MASVIGKQFVRRMSSTAPHSEHVGNASLWKKLSFLIAIPGVAVCWINSYMLAKEPGHDDPPEFIPYEHLRLRSKKFPWGDGNHTLFHSHMNPLPDGYEEEGHH